MSAEGVEGVVGWAVMVAADMPAPAGVAQAWEEEVKAVEVEEELVVMAAPLSVVAPAEEAVMAVAPVGAA